MRRRKRGVPLGVGAVLMPSEETTSGYLGWTREQKLEILTHSLVEGTPNGMPCPMEKENGNVVDGDKRFY